MYATYEGAKRLARRLHHLLRAAEVEIALHECMFAMARGGGYRDWAHLRRTLAGGRDRRAELGGFLERAILSLPDGAVAPATRWIDAQLARFDADLAEASDWRQAAAGAGIWDFVYSIQIVHRAHTPLFRPGSGSGLRVRLSILSRFIQPMGGAIIDSQSLTMRLSGQPEALGFGYIDHPHFQREFARLSQAGILEWDPIGNVLRLNPPPVELVRARVANRRADDGAYWREMAESRLS